jgi:transcriptional regulator with XRE-family HTH domain
MTKQFADLGITLKQLREQSSFTQSNIASFLGVDQSLISKFETGERGIASELLERYACLLGVQMSEIHGGTAGVKPLSIALRATEIAVEDMDAICAVNRIALNCAFLARILEREASHG